MPLRLRRSGTEPLTARSAYGLRIVLAWVGLLVAATGGALFAFIAVRRDGQATGEVIAALLCALVAVSAMVDLVIIRYRRRHPPGAHGSVHADGGDAR